MEVLPSQHCRRPACGRWRRRDRHRRQTGLLQGCAWKSAHGAAAPGERVDAFAAGEDVAEVRLIAEAAFEADLREAQVGAPDQLLGPDDALVANPVLGREAGAALERA